MKSLINTILLIFMSLFALKSQIPNSGFEMGYNSDSSIKHWFNFNAYAIGLNDSILYDGNFVSLSSNAYSGTKALLLKNAFNVTQNTAYAGQASCYADSSFLGFVSAVPFPISLKPNALSFYYLYEQNLYSDSTLCRVRIFNSNHFLIGEGLDTFWHVFENYQQRQVPIEYISTIPSGEGDLIPAFASISFANIVNASIAHTGQRTLIDQLEFITFPNTLSESQQYDNIWLYPNPVRNILYVQQKNNLQNNRIGTLTIMNIFGKLVYSYPLSSQTNQFDIQFLKPGCYFALASIGSKTYVYKLIKE